MQPTEEFQEPERSYPPSYGRPVAIKGVLFILIAFLLLLLGGSQHTLGGWDSVFAAFVLLGLGVVLNVGLIIISKHGHLAYAVAAMFYVMLTVLLISAL